jgi:hypothetical protein
MEARTNRAISALTLGFFFLLAQLAAGLSPAVAAGCRTTNFVVSAPSPALAKEIGDAAEHYRKTLAIEWTGKELPTWSKPCPITARVAPNLGAGGATSFVFDRGEVFGWRMNIQGSRERILDSVLPHEVTHTIFASHFRQPVPRWADEGAATSVEYRSERAKQERMLIEFLQTRRALSFDEMFAMKDYPEDVMPLYSQGHSVAEWLIESRGRREFVDFLADGMRDDNWPRAVHQHYGFENLYVMQTGWLDWVKQGRPQLTPETSPITQLVSNTRPLPGQSGQAGTQAIYRGQSPDDGDAQLPPPLEPVGVASAPAGGVVRGAAGDVVRGSPGDVVRGSPDPAQAAASVPIPATAASGSVYAKAAARAQRDLARGGAGSAAGKPQTIYDASLGGTMRR